MAQLLKPVYTPFRKDMAETVVKKLVNDPNTCVDEALLGYAAVNSHVKLVKGHRIVVRSDLDKYTQSGKVSIVTGGGSGHEPCFAGFVGRGGLTAAVGGSVFTSPPSSMILKMIKMVRNPRGTLVVILNYTGDRLNFGLAVEKASSISDNGPVKSVVFEDDTALTSKDKSAGRRGLAGCALFLKIVGALAESGHSLDEIVSKASQMCSYMGTIGLALSACALPGHGPIFHLDANELELGLGVHGEPGVKRGTFTNAKDAVQLMLNHMTDSGSINCLPLVKDSSLVVLLNNLGGCSQLELNLLCKEVCEWIEEKGLKVVRFLVGSFMTSLNMHGLSITFLALQSKETLQLLGIYVDLTLSVTFVELSWN